MKTRREFGVQIGTLLTAITAGCSYQTAESSEYVAAYNFQSTQPYLMIRFHDTADLETLSVMKVEHSRGGVWDKSEVHPQLPRQRIKYPSHFTAEQIELHDLVLYDTTGTEVERHNLSVPEHMEN